MYKVIRDDRKEQIIAELKKRPSVSIMRSIAGAIVLFENYEGPGYIIMSALVDITRKGVIEYKLIVTDKIGKIVDSVEKIIGKKSGVTISTIKDAISKLKGYSPQYDEYDPNRLV